MTDETTAEAEKTLPPVTCKARETEESKETEESSVPGVVEALRTSPSTSPVAEEDDDSLKIVQSNSNSSANVVKHSSDVRPDSTYIQSQEKELIDSSHRSKGQSTKPQIAESKAAGSVPAGYSKPPRQPTPPRHASPMQSTANRKFPQQQQQQQSAPPKQVQASSNQNNNRNFNHVSQNPPSNLQHSNQASQSQAQRIPQESQQQQPQQQAQHQYQNNAQQQQRPQQESQQYSQKTSYYPGQNQHATQQPLQQQQQQQHTNIQAQQQKQSTILQQTQQQMMGAQSQQEQQQQQQHSLQSQTTQGQALLHQVSTQQNSNQQQLQQRNQQQQQVHQPLQGQPVSQQSNFSSQSTHQAQHAQAPADSQHTQQSQQQQQVAGQSQCQIHQPQGTPQHQGIPQPQMAQYQQIPSQPAHYVNSILSPASHHSQQVHPQQATFQAQHLPAQINQPYDQCAQEVLPQQHQVNAQQVQHHQINGHQQAQLHGVHQPAMQQNQQVMPQHQMQPQKAQQTGQQEQPQSAQSLPHLAGAEEHHNLRKQFELASSLPMQTTQAAQIVGMVGTTPIVKIQGTVGHVVKKKKGRFKLLQEAPVPVAAAGEVGQGNEVPSVVVANRERTLSNGSAMSQITSVTKPATFDGTGAPVVKKKGRFMVTNVKDPAQIASQLAQPETQIKADLPAQQELLQGPLPPIAGSPGSHQKSNSADQSIHGKQTANETVAVVGPDTNQQQAFLPNNLGVLQPQQQDVNQESGIPVRLISPQALVSQPPSQGIAFNPQGQPAYAPVLITQQIPAETVATVNWNQNHVHFDGNTTQSQHALNGGPQITPQQLLYNQQLVPAPPAPSGVQMQPQNVQQLQPVIPVAPPTPPPCANGATIVVQTAASPMQETQANIAHVPLNSLPAKPGASAAEEVTPTSRVTKQTAAPSPAQLQPSRNIKQRNLVAPRNGSGYGATAAGLGKVFYFLDQMKTEVTEADKTIKTLQKDMKFMREKNRELEARNRDLERKNRDLERRLREEQERRQAADTKLQRYRRKEKNAGEVEEEPAADKNQKGSKLSDSPEKKDFKVSAVSNTKTWINGKVLAGTGGHGAKAERDSLSTSKPLGQASQPKAKATGPKQAGPETNKVGSEAASQDAGRGTSKQKPSSAVPTVSAKSINKAQPNGDPKPKNIKSSQSIPKKVVESSVESTIAEKNLAELEATASAPPVAAKTNKAAIGTPLPPLGRQKTKEGVETPINPLKGRVNAPTSPVPGKVPTKALTTDGLPKNGMDAASIKRAMTVPGSVEPVVGLPPQIQRAPTTGPKIPSAIEFDPLKAVANSELNISLDANNGRSTPVDMQSVSSMNNTGLTNVDVGLGLSVPSHLQQPLEMPVAANIQQQAAFPVVGVAQTSGLMGFQQTNGTFHHANATMLPQQLPQKVGELQNTGISPGLSMLQQPLIQVSDQQTIHSMQVADLSQPMILVQPQHIRGLSMDFPSDAMMAAPVPGIHDMPLPQSGPHHTRTHSSQTIANINISPSWNQSSQWAPGMSGGTGQMQGAAQQTHSSDPFDELVSRRQVSGLPSNGA